MVIHGQEGALQEAHTPGILNCTDIRTFWLSRQTGGVRVGRGRSGSNKTAYNYMAASR